MLFNVESEVLNLIKSVQKSMQEQDLSVSSLLLPQAPVFPAAEK